MFPSTDDTNELLSFVFVIVTCTFPANFVTTLNLAPYCFSVTTRRRLRVVHRRDLNLAVDRPRDLLFDTLPVEIPEHDFPLEPCVSLQDPSRRRELRAEFRTNGETPFLPED